MKICALLSWFDEAATWLAGTVASLNGVADHLVAVDGAYALFGDSLNHYRSSTDQHTVVIETCAALNIGLTLHIPNGPFYGNETQKRDLLFQYAEHVTTPDDWLFVIDGDETVSYHRDLHKELAAIKDEGYHVGVAGLRTTLDVGAIPDRLRDQLNNNSLVLDNIQPSLRFYRAHRGIRHENAHYVVTCHIDGTKRYMRGNSRYHDIVPPADLTANLVLDHRPDRLGTRNRARRAYYQLRDELGIERITEGAPT